jgi:predicted DNA-binding protein YlxM (UPF0122 family)
MPTKGLSEVEVDKMVELYELGFSLSEVAELTYASVAAVHKHIRRRGVKMRPKGGWAYNKRRVPHGQLQLTVLLYKTGHSTQQIADQLGITSSTVRHRLQIMGVPIRSKSEGLALSWKNGRRRRGMDKKNALMEELNQGSLIEDHPYTPRNPNEPWGLCACGLAEAAHKSAEKGYEVTGKFKCADCVSKNRDKCNHKGSSRAKVKRDAAKAAAAAERGAKDASAKDRNPVSNNGKPIPK